MSLQTLRDIRLQRLRPPQVELVTMSCPRPNWRWLLEDPAIVWLPAGSDVRAHDLRPLVGLPVTALVAPGPDVTSTTPGFPVDRA